MKLALMLASFAGLLSGQAPTVGRRQFIACPMVRDTKTLPCWLAEYQGETYFLGMQGSSSSDFYPPQLSHEVLVEGTVVEGPRVCGGVPLKPVKISVRPELNLACNTMLPAEEGIEGLAVARPAWPPPTWVKVDGPDRTTIYFDFDSDFLTLHSTTAIGNAVSRIRQAKPARVEIAGQRAATLLSNGQTMTEKAGMAEIRARKVEGILRDLGIPAALIQVQAPAEPVAADGTRDPWNRLVRIVLSEVKP